MKKHLLVLLSLLVVASMALAASRVPVRLAYPATELSLNGSNVMEVGHGINDFFTKVWWDE